MSSIRLPNFFMNERPLYFGDGRNNVAFFFGKIPHQIPVWRVVFSDCSRFLTHKLYHTNNQNTLPPLPTQILGGHVASRGQGLSSKREKEKREPGRLILGPAAQNVTKPRLTAVRVHCAGFPLVNVDVDILFGVLS